MDQANDSITWLAHNKEQGRTPGQSPYEVTIVVVDHEICNKPAIPRDERYQFKLETILQYGEKFHVVEQLPESTL
jgi:hypothetical protein